jgi:hypothetical protein
MTTAVGEISRVDQRVPRALSAFAAAIFCGLVAGYAALGLCVLQPEAVYSGDIGVKYVQAEAVARSKFTTLDIPYPGQFIDPARSFFPLRAPFVMTTGGTTQAIFPPMSAVFQALTVSVARFRGMVVLSLLAMAAILFAAALIAPPIDRAPVLVALGLASPLWFYGVTGWEHAPALAFATTAFAHVVTSRARAAPLIAGILLGTGSSLRDEVLLLLPGLVLLVWLRDRSGKSLALVVGGTIVPLLFSAVVELWWFHRPAAAHLRHAVHFLQSALRLTDGPNPDVPVLHPMTRMERYTTVVLYWLIGYGTTTYIIGFVAGLGIALFVRWLRQSSIGLVIWVMVIAAVAATDFRELVTAPKFLAGLHRVSPYFVFALLPAPVSAARRGWMPAVVLFAAVVYLLVAYAGVDTTGGKALGPRLLLPLLPLLAVTSVASIRAYVNAGWRTDRFVGYGGVLLVAMSASMHLMGTIPAYVARNHDDASAVVAISESAGRIVVADDPFTAQLLFPLYYRKIVFLADTPESGARLGALLGEQKLSEALLVSRLEQPGVSLAPFRLEYSEQRGRMTLQHWRR